MRIKSQGCFEAKPQGSWKPLKQPIQSLGEHWSGSVTYFRSHPIDRTMLGRWEIGYAAPRLIVTDLEPKQAEVCWYGMRCWIE